MGSRSNYRKLIFLHFEEMDSKRNSIFEEMGSKRNYILFRMIKFFLIILRKGLQRPMFYAWHLMLRKQQISVQMKALYNEIGHEKIIS